jgi:hypothetical protein
MRGYSLCYLRSFAYVGECADFCATRGCAPIEPGLSRAICPRRWTALQTGGNTRVLAAVVMLSTEGRVAA